MFVCFEGIAGSGKTTQVKLLADYLEKEKGREVLISAAYEGSRRKSAADFITASGIKSDPVAMMFLFQALHAVQYQEVSRALAEGKIVIADRWRFSFFAHHLYQKTFAGNENLMSGLDLFTYRTLEPDIYFLLEVPPAVAHKRYLERESSINDHGLDLMDDKYFSSVSDYYNLIARKNRWSVINGRQVPQDIFSEVRSIIDRNL